MRGVGDQRAFAVEDRAGEIEPLLDVDARRRGLERDPHFLGGRHEQIVEDFELDRIDLGSDRLGPLDRNHAREDERSILRSLGAPARLNDNGRGGVEDEGGPIEALARRGGRNACFCFRSRDCLNHQRIDDHFGAFIDIAEATAMKLGEVGAHLLGRGNGNFQRRVASGGPQPRATVEFDTRVVNALLDQRLASAILQRLQ